MQAAALVNRLLCAHDGRMELEDLYGQISGLDLNDEVETVLKDMFVTPGDEKVVLAKTSLRLCRDKDCESCSSLHLCKLYLFGDCPYSKEWRGCRFCHDLCLEHNVNLLQQHNLLDLDRSELCVILLQNDSTLLPPVCFPYNKGSGEYGNCPDKEACNRLHICENYIRGTCEGGAECRRCHDIYEPHPMKTLQHWAVPSQMMGSMLPAYKNRLTIQDINRISCSSTPSNSSEKSEICLFYIKGFCKQGNKCHRVHFHLPYKWEERDGNSWKVLPDNEEIERAFSDPAKTHSDGRTPVCFSTMTRACAEVRRLSTLPSVLNATFILTTTWAWYWEDEHGNWIQYGSSQQGADCTSSITSEDLERKYQENKHVRTEFTVDHHSYDISLQDMIQTNRENGSKRFVRRRPLFLPAEEVHKVKIRQKVVSRPLNQKPLPHHWDKTNMPETGFKRVHLHSTSDEYKKIHSLFNQTMSAFNVKSIERVQNQGLWEVFQWQGDMMRKRTAGTENRRLLFHGTESKHVDVICQQNFDWRICGIHATAYGRGSYFARDAKYSHSYTDKSGTRCMFVCSVLVGEYTTGHASYLRPPLKDGQDNIFYDSCVNDINNPSIYVVFEKHQVYPEYIIQYEEEIGSIYQQPLPDEFTSMSFVDSDDQSLPIQLSTHSSFADAISEHSVKPKDPAPTAFISTTFVQKHTFPRYVASAHFLTHVKRKSFNRGHQSPFTHHSKPASLRKTTNSKTVRPQTQQKSDERVTRPLTAPADSKAVKTAKSKDTRQQNSNVFESDTQRCPVPLSANPSAGSKGSKSATTQKAEQPKSKISSSASRMTPATSSAKLPTETKTSTPVRTQKTKQETSNKTRPVNGPVTSSGSSSSHTNAAKSVRSDSVKSAKPSGGPSRSRTSSAPQKSKTTKSRSSKVRH